MQRRELASVLATVRAEFPHVALYSRGNQGIIIAGTAPLVISKARADALGARPEVREKLSPGTSLADFAQDLLVSDEGLDGFIADTALEAGIAPAMLLSTDDNLYLEYATPKNNVAAVPSIEETMAKLTRYRPPDEVAKDVAP
jgi:spermidine synthase